jgi:hypothetical protein
MQQRYVRLCMSFCKYVQTKPSELETDLGSGGNLLSVNAKGLTETRFALSTLRSQYHLVEKVGLQDFNQ